MKILHVTKKYPKAIGGDAVVVSNLEKLQKKSGHEVFVLTSNCPEIDDGDNVRKFGLKDRAENQDRITIRRIISLIFLLALGFKYLNKIKPDIIHSHSPDLGFFISIPARFYSMPIINTCHSLSFPFKQYRIKGSAEKFFLKHTDFKRIITPNPVGVEHLAKIGIKNTVTIPNGVDISAFDGKAEKEGFRFLYVGRLEKEKGLEYLMEAAALIKSEADFRITIVGSGSNYNDLKKSANKLGVNAEFLGYKEGKELVELYASSSAFVLPSEQEEFPLTILEAWSASLPVIATRVGGVTEICTHEENSLLIEPRNSRELADAMLRIIKEKDLGERLGSKGRELVEREYSLEKVSKTTIELYWEILK
jgi:glycosyltransferase involved in cell wall biosynthesis